MTTKDQNAKQEYLKLLLIKANESYSAFTGALRNFFFFSAVFFVFSWFRTSELSLFGAKVDIPQDWITGIAPIVLVFYYFQQISFYLTQLGYSSVVRKFIPEAIYGDTWKPNEDEIQRILEDPSWLPLPSMLPNVSFITALVYLIGSFSIIILVYILPIIVICYFIWNVYLNLSANIAIIIYIVSSLILLASLILAVDSIRISLQIEKNKDK